jgi:hypothetical protein
MDKKNQRDPQAKLPVKRFMPEYLHSQKSPQAAAQHRNTQ